MAPGRHRGGLRLHGRARVRALAGGERRALSAQSDDDEWRPELPPPRRAAGIPDDATWDSELWRWSAVSASDGKERRWAMNGALLQERVGRDYVAYYPDGAVAAKHTRKDGQITHEAFYRDGKPWCVARYVDDPSKDEITPDLVLSAEVFAKDAAPREESASVGETSIEEHAIGKVTLPSGTLVLVDMGALAQWSHEAPHHADLSGSAWAKVARKKNDDYVDLVVTGPDASKALGTFVRAHGATDLFDVERARLDRIREHFAHHTPGLDATLEMAPQRIGHGQRLRLLRDAGLAHVDFSFAHVNVVGVFDLPRSGELDVVGKRDEDQRWAYISLIVKPGVKSAREVEIERLSIEEARFLFADGDALGAWEHERTIDGLHDLVFWGGMEREMVLATGAGLAYGASAYFGWTDLPPGTTPPHFTSQLFALADRNALTVEVRPHSSHHAILRECWTRHDEVGTATIGGAKMCGLFSSVGDGVFPVFAEYDESGEICRVTVKITAAADESDEADAPEHEPHEH